MEGVAILGLAWGIGLWFLWTGYFLLYSPKRFRNWVLKKKSRVVITDLMMTYLGSRAILATSGSMVAGVGSITMALLCFCTGAFVLGTIKCKETISKYV